jgi:putative FmdB family regulatory protein
MPRYDYACAACGRRFEVVHGITEDGPTSCPLCGEGPVRKAFAAPAIHFKGSGWAKKERRATSSPAGSSSSDDGAGESSPASGGDGPATAAGPDASPTEGAASPVSGSAGD